MVLVVCLYHLCLNDFIFLFAVYLKPRDALVMERLCIAYETRWACAAPTAKTTLKAGTVRAVRKDTSTREQESAACPATATLKVGLFL